MIEYRGRSSSTLDAVKVLLYTLFVTCITFAVGAGFAVYTTLRRRGIPVSFLSHGFPFYLYRRSVEAGVEIGLRRLALSVSISFLAAIGFGIASAVTGAS